MSRTPKSTQPLLVPSPTSSNAPPFIVVGEEELAPYTSSVLSLPPSIPELIQCWEQQHERCVQMRRFVERVRVEAVKMGAAPLTSIAAEALATPTATATSGSGLSATPSPPSPQHPLKPAGSPSPGQSPAATTVARGVVATAASVPAAAAIATTGSVVRGTVLTGTVVAATVAGSSPVKVPEGGRTTAATTAAPVAAVTEGELQVLRAKAIGMEAAQQLLASTQDDLRTAERKLARETEKLAQTEERLAQLRAEVIAKDESDSTLADAGEEPSQTSVFAQLQISLELNETILSDTKLKHQSVLYTLAQLTEKMAVQARERAFLEEKNAQLEGQLQRLLMSSMVGDPAATPSQRSGASGAPTSSGPAAASTTPRLSASDSYQKAALEKQIADLQGMMDKLTRDVRKQTARRTKAEETVQALQRELIDLKGSALHFRRQINESELELELAVSHKEDEERLRQLERDCTRLRTALRERTEHFLREKTEWEVQRDVLDAQARVQAAAAQQLLRRLFAHQVKEAALRQCDYAAAVRAGSAGGNESLASQQHHDSSQAATPRKSFASPLKAESPTSRPSTLAAAKVAALPASPACSASPSVPLPLVAAGPVGAAADTATLVNRERQLEELKNTFERRIALVDAQRMAEVRQLHALNKELRAALATSQEELVGKKRQLDAVQQQQQQQRPLALSKFAPPLAGAQSSSSLSERREPAAAWVCRTGDGGDAPGGSMDELSDGVGGVCTPAHTLAVASPRMVTEIERRYDPERMSTWEAVQVENEALLDRLTTMQEEKWKLTSYVEDLQRQGNMLKDELRRNASTMNQLLAAGVLTPAAVSRGSAEGSLRALQCLLQETLQEKFALEEKVRSLSG